MGNRVKIVRIGNREFAVDRKTTIQIYGDKNGMVSVIYDGEIFKIDTEYPIKNAGRDESVKLTFESFETKITIPKTSSYTVYLEEQNQLVSPGNTFLIELYMKDIPFIISDEDKSSIEGIKVHISVESIDLESKQDVESHTLQRMYEDNTSIEMLESKDTVYEDSDSTLFPDTHTLSEFENSPYLDRIGVGGYREVYDVTDTSQVDHIIQSNEDAVIKIAKNRLGVEANKREFQTWCAVRGTNLEKHFCKILNRGPEFRYIVMKKADKVMSDADYEERTTAKHEVMNKIENKIEEETIETPDDHGFDISYGNIGKMEGDEFYKFIDYPFGGRFQFLN